MTEPPPPSPDRAEASPNAAPPARRPLPFLRLSITGVFMGLANLVPGVSGGTMVLVLGLYEEFIGAFSDLTRLRFSRRAIIVVAMLFGISGLTIFGLAGVVQFLMETSLPGMLGLFIGMTLGGVPHLYREMRPLRPTGVAFGAVGLALMALIAVLRPDTADANWALFFVGGVVGSSAMILPGISGSYMLLIMGLYLPIIGAITQFKDALRLRDLAAAFDVGASVLLPVGLGLVVGLVVLSNLLRFLLGRCHGPTIGFLMGLLLGSVLGLYPFQETRFDKLPRYAARENGGRVLRVLGVGWEAGADSPVYRNLQALERDGLRLDVTANPEKTPVSERDVDEARAKSAVLIAYDVAVPREVRRYAAAGENGPTARNEEPSGGEETAGQEVELLIVANTEISARRLVFVPLLVLAGFLTTFLFGYLGGGNSDRRRTTSA